MERERPRPPEPEEDSPVDEAVGPAPVRAGPRCPYCHEDMVHGELASDCTQCHTLHHVACFAENRGCATHACGGHRALSLTVGQVARGLPTGRLSCVRCKKTIDPNTLVARCRCSRVLDAECYGEVKNCTWATCQGPIELMSHSEALAANKFNVARTLAIIAAAPAALSLLLWFLSTLENTSPRDKAELPYVALGLFVLLFVPLVLGSLKLRMDGKRLAALPPPRPGGAPAQPSADPEGAKKESKAD